MPKANRIPWGDAHTTMKKIRSFELDDHAPKGSMELAGGGLLGDMVGDLTNGCDEDSIFEYSWSDLATRSLYRLSYDPESHWAGLTEFIGLQDLFRSEPEVTRRSWYFNPEDQRRPFVHNPEVMQGEVGRLVFLLSGVGDPEVGVEALIMCESGKPMEQADLDAVIEKLDGAFLKPEFLGSIDEY